MSGLTNYALDKPSVAFSGETTQFEDALMKHGVITKEQALLNKGMDAESVAKVIAKDKLAEWESLNGGEDSRIDYHHQGTKKELNAVDDSREEDSSSDVDSDDDLLNEVDSEFLDSYRAQRLGELKEKKEREKFGSFEEISRVDWGTEVNDASANGQWVVVVLTAGGVEESAIVEEEMKLVAAKFRATKFVKIKSTSAIENWPDSNMPAVFCYRDEEMQIQLIGANALGGPGTNAGRIEYRLSKRNIIEGSELEADPPKYEKHTKHVNELDDKNKHRGMAQMSTYDINDDEETY